MSRKTKSSPSAVPVTVPMRIERSRIAALLVGAFEGGSNYWIKRQEFVKIAPPVQQPVLDADMLAEGGRADIWPLYDWPLTEGGEVSFLAADGNDKQARIVLNLDTISAGLQVMADRFPRHFADFIGQHDDSTTSDVFLQCVAFGDIIYG